MASRPFARRRDAVADLWNPQPNKHNALNQRATRFCRFLAEFIEQAVQF